MGLIVSAPDQCISFYFYVGDKFGFTNLRSYTVSLNPSFKMFSGQTRDFKRIFIC